MITYIGVDYSAAAKQPNATWLASGRAAAQLGGQGWNVLVVNRLEQVGSERLEGELLAASTDSVRVICGLDFPFGWPREFLESLIGSGATEPDPNPLSDIGWGSTYEEVEAAAAAFGSEPKTLAGRLISPKAASPMHKINPGLLKMTWQGRRLISNLRRNGFAAPPFDGDLADLLKGESQTPIAMEAYPAALLHAAGLPYRKYKGATTEARAVRGEILAGLCKLHTVKAVTDKAGERIEPRKVSLTPQLAAIAQASDDALDAVLACYSAFLVSLMPHTCDPKLLTQDRETVAMEGWIYTPYSY